MRKVSKKNYKYSLRISSGNRVSEFEIHANENQVKFLAWLEKQSNWAAINDESPRLTVIRIPI
jgi:hypothetical protein